MSVISTHSLRIALVAFALVLAAAPASAATPDPEPADAPAATPAPSNDCGPVLADLGIWTATPAGSPLFEPLPQALQPHCCSQQDVDACRATCKAIRPGCKGRVGCRAGECVCNCDCPEPAASEGAAGDR